MSVKATFMCIPSKVSTTFADGGKCEPRCFVLGNCGGMNESSTFGECSVISTSSSTLVPAKTATVTAIQMIEPDNITSATAENTTTTTTATTRHGCYAYT